MRILYIPILIVFFFLASADAYQSTFLPGIAVSSEYNDNIDLAEEGEAKQDFITSISPSFNYELRSLKNGIQLSFNPSFIKYDKDTTKTAKSNSSSVSLWASISKHTRMEITDTYFYSDVQDYDEDTTVRKNREPYSRNSTSFRLDNSFGKFSSLYLGYIHTSLENDDPEVEDSVRSNPYAGLVFMFSDQLGLEFTCSYISGEFEYSDNLTLEPSDDFDNFKGSLKLSRIFTRKISGFLQYSHTFMYNKGDTSDYQIFDPSLGISYQFQDDFTFSLGLGYYIQDKKRDLNNEDFSINSDLTKLWKLKKAAISLSGSSGYNESYFGAENLGFEIFYQGALSANYSISKKLLGNASATFRHDDYKDIEPDRDDTNIRLSTGITWVFKKIYNINLSYSYRIVDSKIDQNDYKENRVVLQIRLAPSIPLKF